jgi:hypothetical protein
MEDNWEKIDGIQNFFVLIDISKVRWRTTGGRWMAFKIALSKVRWRTTGRRWMAFKISLF